MRQFAISDIHGCNKTFGALLDQIALTREDELYLLGDYIDRGPDSKGVIDRILQLKDEGYRVHCLMGNHEQMMSFALLEEAWKETWTLNGGLNTLESFGASSLFEIPEMYIDFLAHLPLFLEAGGFILVHAGLNFKAENPLSNEFSLVWIRDWYRNINYGWLGDRIILHGHTPVSRQHIELQCQALDRLRVLNIDGGCVFNRRSVKLGYLCAFDMTNRELHFRKSVEGEIS